MSIAAIERFPPRRAAVIWLLRHAGEWLVLAAATAGVTAATEARSPTLNGWRKILSYRSGQCHEQQI